MASGVSPTRSACDGSSILVLMLRCAVVAMCRLSVAMATVAATAAGDNKASSDRLSRDVFSVIHVPHAV